MPRGAGAASLPVTPLHVLLAQAIERAEKIRPGLTLVDIAEAAEMHKQSLYRAREACSPETLARVLETLERLVGLRMDVALVNADSGRLSDVPSVTATAADPAPCAGEASPPKQVAAVPVTRY